MKSAVYLISAALVAGTAFAKLPPAPPVDPAKADEAKSKAAEAAQKGAELQAKYEDKAVANYATKAKAEGKVFKPQMGPGVPPPPAPAVAPAAAPSPVAAAVAKPGTPAAAALAPAKK